MYVHKYHHTHIIIYLYLSALLNFSWFDAARVIKNECNCKTKTETQKFSGEVIVQEDSGGGEGGGVGMRTNATTGQ